jgi:hypothetical protein
MQLFICGQSHSLCVEFSLKDVLETAATIGNVNPRNIMILKEGINSYTTLGYVVVAPLMRNLPICSCVYSDIHCRADCWRRAGG